MELVLLSVLVVDMQKHSGIFICFSVNFSNCILQTKASLECELTSFIRCLLQQTFEVCQYEMTLSTDFLQSKRTTTMRHVETA